MANLMVPNAPTEYPDFGEGVTEAAAAAQVEAERESVSLLLFIVEFTHSLGRRSKSSRGCGTFRTRVTKPVGQRATDPLCPVARSLVTVG